MESTSTENGKSFRRYNTPIIKKYNRDFQNNC